MVFMNRAAALALSAIIVLASCTALGDLRCIVLAVSERFPAENPEAGLRNSRVLELTLINSPLTGSPDSSRAHHARRVAQEAFRACRPSERIVLVRVIFLERHDTPLVTRTTGRGSYSFSPIQLRPAEPATRPVADP
jgi:hypothetical protein